MRYLKLFSALFGITLLVGCGVIPADYKGPDAGYAVIGIGATTGTRYNSYSFSFRKTDGTDRSSFTYFQENFVYDRGDDYANDDETGVVEVRALAPGDYELYSYSLNSTTGTLFWPREEFSIPFSIEPGETAYLGNYQANGIWAKNFLGVNIAQGALFFHSDRRIQDLEIAKSLKPEFDLSRVSVFLAPEEVVRKLFLNETEQEDFKNEYSND